MKKFVARGACDLKTFTDENYPQGSFAFAALLRARDIRVNGVRTGANVRLNTGDEVTYYTTPAQEAKRSHDVIYADENVMVCDKYSGVSSEGLASELCHLGALPVHRLDRNTEGLIVYALGGAAEEELLRAFRQRRVHKTYLALCKDAFAQPCGTLTAYIKKGEGGVKVYGSPCAGALTAVTEYRVEERTDGIALVNITLHTGRTHQIRAHMAFIGCPVLGDEKYGDGALNKKYGARRQRLVSKTLQFELEGPLKYLNDIKFISRFVPHI